MRASRAPALAQMVAAGAIAILGGGSAVAVPVAAAAIRMIPASAGHVLSMGNLAAPPTTADCEATYGIACYQPFQLRRAYDLQPLYSEGVAGQGQTIVIVDAFGSPTIREDLARFDQDFGLPAPPSFQVVQPEGPVPSCGFDPFGASDCYGWGTETSLDVEWAHTIAPAANIVLVETPTSETEGLQGFPDIVAAENWVVDHHIGEVITQSFGATEQTFSSPSQIYGLRSAYMNAAANGVTVLAASGDQGATDYLSNETCCYASRAIDWPSSDPLVTAVGGTQLHLNAAGVATAPASVWNDSSTTIGIPGPAYTWGAGGGGLSTVFSRPAFQNGVAGVVGDSRGTPDIAMSAAVNGAVDFFQSTAYYYVDGVRTEFQGGWSIVGGTSEASPLFSGIVALADQEAGHSLGYLNPELYALGEHGGDNGIVPITSGNNTFTFCIAADIESNDACPSSSDLVTVHGFHADGSYSDATGWGTVDAAQFVPALARGAASP
ncbi:MAG: S53 family peptidase [Candidatus Dormibacteria bacterium]|jgi:subtilase family serine protease